jgi:hypothetical protein
MPKSGQYTDALVAETTPATTLADPLAEALRLIGLADAQGATLRLMGGLAFHARAPEWKAGVERERRDIDLATWSRDRKAVAELLAANGYVPDRQYNALYGHKQLYFVDPTRDRPVDVLVDRLEMCHSFVFADRLAIDRPTLPLAELLLSKLQVVKLNRKDVLDSLILLAEHPLTPDDTGINTTRITALTSTDWGWWRTVTGNLDRLVAFLESEIGAPDLDTGRPNRYEPAAQVQELRAAIDAGQKSTRWRLRSRIGDKVTWYEEPEEVGHGR